jgi:steroid delta-isomerase-like uncharacterized protein
MTNEKFLRFSGIVLLIPLSILLCFTFACQQAEEGITQEEAKVITDQVLRLWNEGDIALTDDLFHPEYVRHHPVPSVTMSIDELKNTVISNRSIFPNYNLTFDDCIIQGDRIIAFATVTGTNTASLEEMPATGKTILMNGIYVYLINNGKIAEEWTYFNLLSYYQQLGYTLAPPLSQDFPKEKELL